jgi:hypothetical protein
MFNSLVSFVDIDSMIVDNLRSRKKLLKLCEFKSKQEFVLLYRGSLHGFEPGDFHLKCDNIAKTLTVIKAAESGNIFGGYTEATWDESDTYKSDEKAFIFSLVNKENKPVKVNVTKGKKAIGCYS